jgi:hypothetical protein
MRIRFLLGMALALFALTAQASAKIDRVIYITLDGTKWQDIFDPARMPIFWQKHASQFKIYGLPNSNTSIEVASIAVSLPSYQSQMTGAVQPCDGNGCGRVTVQTFPEYLVQNLKMKKTDVVSFSSWGEVNFAVQSKENTLVANDGVVNMVNPLTQQPDPFMWSVNRLQQEDHPDHALLRYDRYTYMQAKHYFSLFEPKFMWLSFCDSDNNAHANNAPGYYKAIAFYDQVIDELITNLKHKNLLQHTLIIITTDHGRGDGANWTTHGPKYPESKRTWAFVLNGDLQSVREENGIHYYSTLSMRPTIEAVFKKHQ